MPSTPKPKPQTLNNGNILGIYRDNGKENVNNYSIIGYILGLSYGIREYILLGLCRDYIPLSPTSHQ